MTDLPDLPELRDPILIASFEGWNDAGEAATSALVHLAQVWQAEQIWAMDPEDYYDFQVNRPKVVTTEGGRRIEWPTTRVYVARQTGFDRDVVLVHGIEPSFRWQAYALELAGIALQLDVTTCLTLGALLADVPHTRPLPVTTTSDDDDVAARYDVERSRYEGPTGIVGVLIDAAERLGLATLSSWVAVPHYAGGPPSPKAALALITAVEAIVGATVPLGELPEDARAWERGVNELAESDEDVAEYVQSLEEQTDTVDLPEASGDAIAREFERYLRRRTDGDGGA